MHLARNQDNDVVKPIRIQILPDDKKCIFVACGTNHSMAICKDGTTLSWGSFSGGRSGVSFKRLFDTR